MSALDLVFSRLHCASEVVVAPQRFVTTRHLKQHPPFIWGDGGHAIVHIGVGLSGGKSSALGLVAGMTSHVGEGRGKGPAGLSVVELPDHVVGELAAEVCVRLL